MNNNKLTLRERVISILLDQFIMILVMMAMSIPVTVTYRITHPVIIGAKYQSFKDSSFVVFWLIIAISVYFNKDAFGGRSLAKRFFTKLQVVNHKTKQIASPFRCLIRNSTAIIWPLEIAFVLIDPERRLGDKLAGTELVYFDPSAHIEKTSWLNISISIFITISTLSMLYFFAQ